MRVRKKQIIMNQPLNKIEPEYEDSYNNWVANPGVESQKQFIEHIDPIITKYLNSVPAANRDLIKTQAQVLAVKSLAHYDPKLSSLNTFMGQQFMGLRRKSRQQDPTNIIRLPEHIQLQQQKLYEAQSELVDSLGRVPSTAELADKTGIPVKTIERIKARRLQVNSGALMREGDDGLDDALPGIKSPISFKAQTEFVYNELGPTDQFIFEHSEGFSPMFKNKALSNAELARKTGLSLATISQKKAKIQKLLEKSREVY